MIRRLTFLLALLALVAGTAFAASDATSSSSADSSLVHWLSYNQAMNLARVQKKLVFVDLYADWCVPCRIMDVNVYGDSAVAKLLNERFIPVKLDADSEEGIVCDGKKNSARKCFSSVWELKALPSFVLVAPKGMSILTVTQSMTVDDMLYLLNQFLSKEKEWIAR